MSIIGIIAVAENLAIGKGGKLPWHYSSDLKFFKLATQTNMVVMGWNTWNSIGKPLPNRLNVVLSRHHQVESQPHLLQLRSKEEVLALADYLEGDVFIIGGAETYKLFTDEIEKWLVTEVPQKIENADTFVAADFLENFKLRDTVELEEDLRVKIYERN
jgi:dihydrofolate reductase